LQKPARGRARTIRLRLFPGGRRSTREAVRAAAELARDVRRAVAVAPARSSRRLAHLGRELAALGACFAVVAWRTWPLLPQAASRMVCVSLSCGYDPVYSAWVLAWATHALGTAPWAIAGANIYVPAPHALFYGPSAFGALPLFAPVFALTGNAALALNVMVIAAVTLTAYGVHRVAASWTGSAVAGGVAAVVLLRNGWLWSAGVTVPHQLVLVYLPWIVALGAAGRAGWRSGLTLAVLVALQALVEPVYFAPAVFVPLALVALWRLGRPGTRAAGAALVGTLAAAFVLVLPVYAGYLVVRAENPALAGQTLWGGTVLTPFRSPVRLGAAGITGNGTTDVGWPVLVVLALGVAGRILLRRDVPPAVRHGWHHAAVWTITGVLLSTRVVAWGDGPPHELPYFAALASTPLLGLLRILSRIGVGAMIGISLLAGLAVDTAARAGARTLRRPRVAGPLRVVLGGALVGVLVAAMAEQPALGLRRPPETGFPVLHAVRAGGGPLLEVPAGLYPTGFDQHVVTAQAAAMYRSTTHWRPLVNGYSSYFPASFPEIVALAGRLPDAAALAELRGRTGLTAILVHLDGLDAATVARWRAAPSLRLVAADPRHLLFAVGVAPGDPAPVR
jgi:hypothetical protein